MTTRPNANLHPSIDEFSGHYNIPDQGTRRPVLRSADGLPEFAFPELWAVYNAAKQWFEKAAPHQLVRPDFDPFAYEPFYVHDETDDRTMFIDIDFRCLTTQLLQRIQQEFLSRFFLWRVVLVGEDSSTAIVIYPNTIRFGNQHINANPDEALRDLVTHGLAMREARLRPRYAYLAELLRRLPGAVQAVGDRPFLVAGAIDNYEGDYSRLSIWLLIRGADDRAVDFEYPTGAGNDFWWSPMALGVNAEGGIVCRSPIPKTVSFCLTTWIPPAAYRGPLSIVERESGNRQTYELRSEDIVFTSHIL